MLPQLACGGRTPTPKKLSADSSRMPRATASVIDTTTACAAFGSRCQDQQACVAGAGGACALDEAARAKRPEFGADDARRFHPARHADQHDQQRHRRLQDAAAIISSGSRGTASIASVPRISTASIAPPA